MSEAEKEKQDQNTVTRSWKIKKMVFWFAALILLGAIYIGVAASVLYEDKKSEDAYWNSYLEDSLTMEEQTYVDSISKDATPVTTGSYLECIKEINMKTCSYRAVIKLWFKWENNDELDMINNFHVYNGTINKLEILEDREENGQHYQLARVDMSVFKNFWTRRFPVESHQLRYYVEPAYTGDQVILVADKESSGTNSNLSVSGFNLVRFDNGVHTQIYDSTYGDDSKTKAVVTSEYLGQMELNRDSWGLYLKCFIALFGTSLWVFITVFLCTFHRVDPLSMIPAALFGTVSNIMVGANLLPDALQVGLLEFVNIWGIFTILAGALVIININNLRNNYHEPSFAKKFGHIMFFSLLILVILGHIILPLSAYNFL